MGSLERRLEQLEKQFKSGEQANPGGGMSSREWERYFHAYENTRREQYGLEPLPGLEYTEEDYEIDLDTLENVIPAHRESLGWQTEEAKAFLDEWERDIEENLCGKD